MEGLSECGHMKAKLKRYEQTVANLAQPPTVSGSTVVLVVCFFGSVEKRNGLFLHRGLESDSLIPALGAAISLRRPQEFGKDALFDSLFPDLKQFRDRSWPWKQRDRGVQERKYPDGWKQGSQKETNHNGTPSKMEQYCGWAKSSSSL